ncbi:Kinesin-like protein [Dirofilaria immitis]|nr:Kinesin-like protein [Dirofilaria immitis]
MANPVPNPAECGIQVFCRVRPLNSMEEKGDSKFVPKFSSDSQEAISVAGKVYVFDKVFKPTSTQEEVYMGAAYHIVQDVLSGYNGTVFAYGQTSSGKTHTMEGVFGDSEKQGIIPRIVQDIFNHIYNMDVDLEFHIKVSYFEIYNEKIRDLLDVTKMNLAIHEDKNRVPYVKEPQNDSSLVQRKLWLALMKEKIIDMLLLQVSKTGAEGTVLEEAKNINKSLSALGNVIAALAEGTKGHVPYRDSKLTRILQESLGGNSRTTIVICCSPASVNEAETKSTLMFGQRAKTIKNVVIVNEELTAEEWKRRYEREKEKVFKLKQQLVAAEAELNRWRKGEKVPEAEWINLLEGAAVNLQLPSGAESLSPSVSDSVLGSLDRSISVAPVPLLTSAIGAITDADRKKYEEERSALYQQLDEKDDEITLHSQLAERLKQQMNEQEELIRQIKLDYENAQAEVSRIQNENEASKEESKEVLTALEELAMNYDIKTQEAEQKIRENEQLSDELSKKNVKVVELTTELETLRESCAAQKNFNAENGTDKPYDEELFAHARICISKLSADFKSTLQKMSNLESGSGDVTHRLEITEKELADCRLFLQQNEAKNKSLQETIAMQEKVKRQLEEQVDMLNEKLAAAGDETVQISDEAKEQHTKQVAALRDEVAEKSRKIEELTALLQDLRVAKNQLQADYEKLKMDEQEQEKRIKELSGLSEKREQAKRLEETVAKELQTLHNLRKMFVQDIGQRIKRAPTGTEPSEEEYMSSPAQKQKIAFLENNLDQLTKVHKQLVRDNADLRCELPKMENDCVQLWIVYQHEVERIKEAVRQRNLARRGLAAPQIAKPIRPGQHYSPVGTTMSVLTSAMQSSIRGEDHQPVNVSDLES